MVSFFFTFLACLRFSSFPSFFSHTLFLFIHVFLFICLRGSPSVCVSVCPCVYFFALVSVSLSVSPSFPPSSSVNVFLLPLPPHYFLIVRVFSVSSCLSFSTSSSLSLSSSLRAPSFHSASFTLDVILAGYQCLLFFPVPPPPSLHLIQVLFLSLNVLFLFPFVSLFT